MTEEAITAVLLSFQDAFIDYPFGEKIAVFKIRGTGGKDNNGKMFAIVAEGSHPVQVSLKCDPQLAELLREKYESVLPGYHLNKKHWNTLLLTGQVPDDEVIDLARLSYNLVVGKEQPSSS